MFEEIHDWQDLSVVGNQALREHIACLDEVLQVDQSFDNDLRLLGVEGLLDGDDQLGKHWQDALLAGLDQRGQALVRQELVGVLGLAKTVEEDGQVVVVVKFLNLYDPSDLAMGTQEVDHDRQVTSVIAHLEDGRGDNSILSSFEAYVFAAKMLVFLILMVGSPFLTARLEVPPPRPAHLINGFCFFSIAYISFIHNA